MTARKNLEGRFFRRGALKFISGFTLKLIMAGAFLCFFGGLSLRASVAIVALLAVVGIWTREKPSNDFTLYEVKIVPHIGLMLGMLGLVTKEEWERLNQNRPASGVPLEKWTSLHLQNGITAIVLSDHPREPSSKILVHWTSHNAETGRDFCLLSTQYRKERIEYSVSLDFLKIKELEYPDSAIFDWSPGFFFEQGTGHFDGGDYKRAGYEIGIEVATSWWNGNKVRLENEGRAKFLKVHDAPGECAWTRIVFAVLPCDVFLLFDARNWDLEFARNIRERVKEELALARWRIECIGFEDNIEMEALSMGKLGESYIGDFADVTVKALAP